MTALPEADALRTFYRRALTRARWRTALSGAAAGLAAAAVAIVVALIPRAISPVAGLAVGLALSGAGLALGITRLSMESVVKRLERGAPASRNLLYTAFELSEGRIRAGADVRARVAADATRFAGGVDLARLFPARAGVVTVCASIVLVVLSATSRPLAYFTSATGRPLGKPGTLRAVSLTITPPAYSGRPAHTLRDPARIDALAGSRIDLIVTAEAADVRLLTVAGTQPFARGDAGTFTASTLADADGFLGIEPRTAAGATGQRRLIGLTVIPDHAPTVRITAPGHDMLVPNGPRSLTITVDAEDDLALESLKLTFTRISGSGENFTFKNGDVPVELTRTNDRKWSGSAAWALGPLKLERGDMLVYRAAARDRRPGAPFAESDAFIVEITAPGALPSEGFAIDDRQDKYAISQQMVIVKTERALGARKSLSDDEFREQVLDLAAEQRQVRAEFVFMMGGELADAGLDLATLNEEAEAAGEEDLAAGRLANQGRLDLLRAIRAMSRAAARLAEADAPGALPLEKDALAYLQKAFSRSRYILRTLGVRERLDLSRRLTGVLASLAQDARPAAAPEPNPRIVAARRLLAELAAAGDRGPVPADAIRDRPPLAQRVLQIDPTSPALRDVAAAITGGDVDAAAVALAAFVRAEAPADPARPGSRALDALAGALADALRRQEKRQ